MSADNWAVCPKCLKRAEAEKEKRHAKAAKAYGKVPADEWRALVAEAEKPVDVPETLREDYQLGVTDGGEFYVIYRCSCQHCGFAHEFKHEQQLKVD